MNPREGMGIGYAPPVAPPTDKENAMKRVKDLMEDAQDAMFGNTCAARNEIRSVSVEMVIGGIGYEFTLKQKSVQ